MREQEDVYFIEIKREFFERAECFCKLGSIDKNKI